MLSVGTYDPGSTATIGGLQKQWLITLTTFEVPTGLHVLLVARTSEM